MYAFKYIEKLYALVRSYFIVLLQPHMQFFQECLYKYHTVQYTLGEKDREKILLSTDVNWHCESSKLDVIYTLM